MNQNPNTSGPLPTFESFLASRTGIAEKVEEGKAVHEAEKVEDGKAAEKAKPVVASLEAKEPVE